MPEKIKSANPKFLNVSNYKIRDSIKIVEHFNKHIGKALADKVDSVHSYDYRSSLSDPTSSSMFFPPTFDSEIINIVNQLDSHKGCGSDINAKNVIFAAYVIAPYPNIRLRNMFVAFLSKIFI